MPIERIDNLSDTRLDAYRNVKRVTPSRDSGLMIAEGPTVCERVFHSGTPVESVLISDRKLARFEHRIPPNVPVFLLEHSLAQELVGFSFHRGVLAQARRPNPPALHQILPTEGPAFLLIGERIADPENVGALIRIASAFGANAVVFGPGTADPFSRRVLRVSMGNGMFLPVLETTDLRNLLLDLRTTHNMQTCGALLDDSSESVEKFCFGQRSAIVLGHEYDGLSAEVSTAVERKLRIPMSNGTDSLNVAIAAGILSWARRQQTGGVL